MSAEVLTSSGRPAMCSAHPKRQLELRCIDCCKDICISCFTSEHKLHNVEELRPEETDDDDKDNKGLKKTESQQPNASTAADAQLIAERISAVKRASRRANARKKAFLANVSRVRSQITETGDQLRRRVDARVVDLLAEVDRAEAAAVGEMDRVAQRLELTIATMEKFAACAADLTSGGGLRALLGRTATADLRGTARDLRDISNQLLDADFLAGDRTLTGGVVFAATDALLSLDVGKIERTTGTELDVGDDSLVDEHDAERSTSAPVADPATPDRNERSTSAPVADPATPDRNERSTSASVADPATRDRSERSTSAPVADPATQDRKLHQVQSTSVTEVCTSTDTATGPQPVGSSSDPTPSRRQAPAPTPRRRQPPTPAPRPASVVLISASKPEKDKRISLVLPADDAKCSKESDITKPKPLPKTADKRVDEPKTKEKAEETAAEKMSSAAPAAAVDITSASSSSSPTSEEDLKVQEVQAGVRNLKSLFENMAKLNSDRDRQVQNEMKAKRYEGVVNALQNGTETKATNDGSAAETKDSTEGSAHLEMHVKEHTFHDEGKKEDPVKAVDVEGEKTPKDHPGQAMSTTAVAVQDYDAQADDEISFQAGELIVDIHFEFINDVWWKGVCRGQRGMFPASHVQQQSS